MKGVQGLIIAAILGVFGGALNWVYLQQKTQSFKTRQFVGIKPGATLIPGDLIKEEHLEMVPVPAGREGDLAQFAYLWETRKTVAGIRATRKYTGGELVFRTDYTPPPPDLKLAENQRLIWITVDSRTFVPDLVDPGDEITFLVPTAAAPTPAPLRPAVDPALNPDPAAGGAENPAPLDRLDRLPTEGTELIGPFVVGSLGNRLGSIDVMKANRLAQSNERQVGIMVTVKGTKLDENAMKLLDRLRKVNYTNIGVALHKKKGGR